MKCPACKSDLVVVEREGIEVDWCLDCGGLWFDEGELELLGEKAGRSITAQILESENNLSMKGQRRCARCPKRMECVEVDLSDGEPLHTDLSMTVFLSAPENYAGGELDFETAFGSQSFKLPAGHAFIYSKTMYHRVTPVTRGTRLAAVA